MYDFYVKWNKPVSLFDFSLRRIKSCEIKMWNWMSCGGAEKKFYVGGNLWDFFVIFCKKYLFLLW